jgi:hypothetical protein
MVIVEAVEGGALGQGPGREREQDQGQVEVQAV